MQTCAGGITLSSCIWRSCCCRSATRASTSCSCSCSWAGRRASNAGHVQWTTPKMCLHFPERFAIVHVSALHPLFRGAFACRRHADAKMFHPLPLPVPPLCDAVLLAHSQHRLPRFRLFIARCGARRQDVVLQGIGLRLLLHLLSGCTLESSGVLAHAVCEPDLLA